MKISQILMSALMIQGLFGAAHAQSVYEKAMDPDQRIAFDNDGGLMDGGVCWWHSRLQRAFYELAVFAPDRPKPSMGQVREILNQLMKRNSMVTIPGYSDVHSFTSDFEGEVQSLLNRWQIVDGFVNQEWIRGISGRYRLDPIRMRQRMDKIYLKFIVSKRKDDLLWVMLQAQGITSHASLILDMVRNSQGYEITMLDSNFTNEEIIYHYKIGDSSLEAYGNEWVPYIGFTRDQRRINRAQNRQRFLNPILDSELEIDSVIEID